MAKRCPGCASANADDATRCACGFTFAPGPAPAADSAADQFRRVRRTAFVINGTYLCGLAISCFLIYWSIETFAWPGMALFILSHLVLIVGTTLVWRCPTCRCRLGHSRNKHCSNCGELLTPD